MESHSQAQLEPNMTDTEQISNYDAALADLLARLADADRRLYEASQQKLKAEHDQTTIRRELLGLMQENGLLSDENARASVTVRKGSLKTIIDDPALLPTKFQIRETVVKADTRAVREAITEGETILGARVERQPDTLVVKWKDKR